MREYVFAAATAACCGMLFAGPLQAGSFKQEGKASWYKMGNKTANGERYDPMGITAAHPSLPFDTRVRVTNPASGKSVVVRINDRGPFHADRIIDLSYAAADRIGIVAAGSGRVVVERLVAEPTAAAPAPPPEMARVETPMVAREAAAMWLQLGAFSSAEGAESFREKVAREMPWLLEPIQVSPHDGLHRVRLGPYRNLEEASAIGDMVRRSLGFAPLLTHR
jgi:rare lipoprotein A